MVSIAKIDTTEAGFTGFAGRKLIYWSEGRRKKVVAVGSRPMCHQADSLPAQIRNPTGVSSAKKMSAIQAGSCMALSFNLHQLWQPVSVNITFLGGAGIVIRSKYLVRHDGKRLLVDCGLFQCCPLDSANQPSRYLSRADQTPDRCSVPNMPLEICDITPS